MLDLSTEVQHGGKVTRLTIIDDLIAVTSDLVSLVAIATDAHDAEPFQSAQAEDDIKFETA
jgi:hypothetical protein